MDNHLDWIELLKFAGTMFVTGASIVGALWKFLGRVISAFEKMQAEINKLTSEKVNGLADTCALLQTKLDKCEEKHEVTNQQVGQLRADNGELKGKVLALEVLAKALPEKGAK